MTTRKILATIVLAMGLTSCGEPTTQPTPETKSVTTLIISKKNGATERIGTLTFQNGDQPTLEVEANTADGEGLRKAWDEIAAMETVPMSDTRTDDRDGKPVMTFGKKLVPPGKEDYKWAIYDYLERRYGYQVDVKEP